MMDTDGKWFAVSPIYGSSTTTLEQLNETAKRLDLPEADFWAGVLERMNGARAGDFVKLPRGGWLIRLGAQLNELDEGGAT